jgi:hypothetical protein
MILVGIVAAIEPIDPIGDEMLVGAIDRTSSQTIVARLLAIVARTIVTVPTSGESVHRAIAIIAAAGKIRQHRKSPKKKSQTTYTASIQSSPRSKTNAKSIGSGYSPNSVTIPPSLRSLPKLKLMAPSSMK